MNRIGEFDTAFLPRISGTTPAAVRIWTDGRQRRALLRRAAERIAAIEPELSALLVIAPFVIAVLAALPTFLAA
jgi:hypothetical protein